LKHRIVGAILGFALVVGLPLQTTANGPLGGSVHLPNGRVLPPLPADQLRPSVAAEMLAAHPEAPVRFLPGARPSRSLARPSNPASSVASTVGTAALVVADSSVTPSFTLATAQAPARGAAALGPLATTASGPAGPLPNGLRKEVLGFLPYWFMDPADIGYIRYDLASTIAYFSIGANSDGTLLTGSSANPSTGWAAWNSSVMTTVINTAHAAGVRVVPTITMMAWSGDYSAMTAVLTDPARRAKLIGQIASAIGSRNADGVNIDFEPVPTSLRDAFTAFIRQLKAGLVAAGVGSYVTVDAMAGAASWATGYDVTALSATGVADALMVMAYDFSWSGSARAGGVAPITSPYIFDSTDALTAYLQLAPPGKIIWGIPYYGRTWPTLDNTLNAQTCRATSPPVCPETTVTSPSSSNAYYYVGAKKLAGQYGRQWDATGQVPWFDWRDSTTNTWYEGYYDDAQSLGVKYGMVNANDLAGIGIWTLLMDAGTDDLANVIRDRFVKVDTRLAGPDRYATAAAISAWRFSPGVPVAYVATGEKFPDALAAGPAATAGRGPVLLTGATDLPAATALELSRLKPGRIVVLGSSASVSDGVLNILRSYTSGSVTRTAGVDRFATAAAISRATFPAGAPVAYIANGMNFPDALAGGAAAARAGGPILLVQPTILPIATASELARLKPAKIVVLGDSRSVSDAVAARLSGYTSGGVARVAGADRYATSVAISQTGFRAGQPGTVFVATGETFPDALSADPVAAALGAPVLLVPPTTPLPQNVADELVRLNPWRVVFLGGTPSISTALVSAIDALWN
jgi:spore germination protein YaaH/putative cell wall-binding protein